MRVPQPDTFATVGPEMQMPLQVAVIGAGWAGCAAAVAATRQGHAVTLFEAAAEPGGRARSVTLPDGTTLDNGQHILIGAYRESLRLMQELGVDTQSALLRLPLDLRTPDGHGLCMPSPAGHPQLDVLRAILRARGWSWAARLSLLRVAARWQWQRFRAAERATVQDVCHGLHPRVMADLVTPLCISAFNSQPADTSGSVFLRVLQDALLAERGGSDALIARESLGELLPRPAAQWLERKGASVHLGCRVRAIHRSHQGMWELAHDRKAAASQVGRFDRIILAVPAREAARLVSSIAPKWADVARTLQHAPIATTYARYAGSKPLPPMQALRDTPERPAQFVFSHDAQARTTSGGRKEQLLAFVTSCCELERDALENAIRAQASEQLGLEQLDIIATLVDKRATFMCHAGVLRPPAGIAAGLQACGDYVEGSYPATLEGAVRSGLAAATALPAASVNC